MTISILNLKDYGTNCITSQDGQKVHDVIYPELKKGEQVILDFAGVQMIASPFFNAAVGLLLRDLSTEDLNRCLKITNLPLYARPILKHVISNAKDYYSV